MASPVTGRRFFDRAQPIVTLLVAHERSLGGNRRISRRAVISKEAPRRTVPWPGTLRADLEIYCPSAGKSSRAPALALSGRVVAASFARAAASALQQPDGKILGSPTSAVAFRLTARPGLDSPVFMLQGARGAEWLRVTASGGNRSAQPEGTQERGGSSVPSGQNRGIRSPLRSATRRCGRCGCFPRR